ncbi:MAG: serine protease [Pseudomonadota bacterium]
MDTATERRIAALEHLTGVARHCVTWIDTDRADLVLHDGRLVLSDNPGEPAADAVARIEAQDDGYLLRKVGPVELWVNRTRCAQCRLAPHDVIEFGERGPLTRFRIFRENQTQAAPIDAILADAVSYLRNSRRPVGRRILKAAGDLLRRLALQSTMLFRIGVLVALAVLGIVLWQQYRLAQQFELRIAAEANRLEAVSAAVARAREEALRGADLAALRAELSRGILSNDERLAQLERRSEASARVILDSLASVVFLQGAYGFTDPETGRMLRHSLSSTGQPLMGPRGQPLLTLEGAGPPVELHFTGTGFILAGTQLVITNRHVALPWETNLPAMPGIAGLEPTTLRFLAWLPGFPDPLSVTLQRASESADLAILRLADPDATMPPGTGLSLATSPSKPGDTVILMGFPTGLRSLLAQAGAGFVQRLQAAGDTDFWGIAGRLAEAGHIVPLSSRGIVGQTTTAAIVYDAETTHGGSGGPVLNLDGHVVAVNAAILPEFGGSNLGVPVADVRALLRAAGLAPLAPQAFERAE